MIDLSLNSIPDAQLSCVSICINFKKHLYRYMSKLASFKSCLFHHLICNENDSYLKANRIILFIISLLVRSGVFTIENFFSDLPVHKFRPPMRSLLSVWASFQYKYTILTEIPIPPKIMMTLSNGNIFRVTGHLCGEFTGHRWIRWIPRTKPSDAEL